MNLISNFEVREIRSDFTHYLLRIDTYDSDLKVMFANAPGFNKRQECLGIEIDNFSSINKNLSVKKSDFAEYGICNLKKSGSFKMAFSIESKFLNGNYVLMRPSWAKNCNRNMWVLIPSN